MSTHRTGPKQWQTGRHRGLLLIAAATLAATGAGLLAALPAAYAAPGLAAAATVAAGGVFAARRVRAHLDPRAAWLIRLRDHSGQLLAVYPTDRAGRGGHAARTEQWADQVADVHATPHPGMRAAVTAAARAERREPPRYRLGGGNRPVRDPLGARNGGRL